MNTSSCDMHYRTDLEFDHLERWQDGDFMFYDSVVSKARPMCYPKDGEETVTIKYLCMMLPGHRYCSVPIRPVPKADMPINGDHSWEWDGNVESPTLVPSVNAVDRWHGWIRAGKMVSC